MTGALLRVENLDVFYPARGFRQRPYHALNNVCLDIRPGETVGLVGESGSGKTTLGRAILGLAPVSSGRIEFQGRDISKLRQRERRELAQEIQVVFQDPYSSLNPAMRVADILSEPLQNVTRRAARAKVRELLDEVGLPADAEDRLPREFSGGQRQRIAIARALALEPELIVCDEPVSALDLSTQQRVLELLLGIQERKGVSYLFISHDLSVVRFLSHRIAVMYQGQIVEWGTAEQVTGRPTHPYTEKLLMSAPVSDPVEQQRRRKRRREIKEKESKEALFF